MLLEHVHAADLHLHRHDLLNKLSSSAFNFICQHWSLVKPTTCCEHKDDQEKCNLLLFLVLSVKTKTGSGYKHLYHIDLKKKKRFFTYRLDHPQHTYQRFHWSVVFFNAFPSTPKTLYRKLATYQGTEIL